MPPLAIAAIIVIVLILIWIIATFNGFVGLRNKVEEAFATMDVYLKKRWDLVPNLVETVKGYMKHENSTLKEIVKLRNGGYDDLSADEKVEVNNKISRGINKLLALAEDYPDLKANENFVDLSHKLEKIEEDIANSRKFYNATVMNYNNKVQMIPTNIVALIFGFRARKMFNASEEERENVKVEF